MLLINQKLSSDWINLEIGEPYLVRDAFIESFDLKKDFEQLKLSKIDFSYPYPQGYPALVELLEEKHKAKVVITNGAKQGLMAILYVLHKKGKIKLGIKKPYWALMPQACKIHNIEMIAQDNLDLSGLGAYLIIAPNNPDGFIDTPDNLKKFAKQCKDQNITLIHDGVYYNHGYLPATFPLDPIGDLQVFSFSKLWGLSGLRLGYIICHNDEYLNDLVEFVESDTTGVSLIVQDFAYQLLNHRIRSYETLAQKFEGTVAVNLEKNFKLFDSLDSEMLGKPVHSTGMFAWCKKQNTNFEELKIKVAAGKWFGDDNYVRLNMAVSAELLEKAITRIKDKSVI